MAEKFDVDKYLERVSYSMWRREMFNLTGKDCPIEDYREYLATLKEEAKQKELELVKQKELFERDIEINGVVFELEVEWEHDSGGFSFYENFEYKLYKKEVKK